MKRLTDRYLPDGGTTGRRTVVTCCLLALSLFQTKVDAQESDKPGVAGRVVIESLSWEQEEVLQYCADEAHSALMNDDPYPSAKKCAGCHPQHYREWSVSPHAYAQLSPIFNCMQNAVKILTNGTNADFCIRCHTAAGMDRNEPITMTNLDRHPTAREGVTCISCHRVNQAYGKGSGRRKLVRGGLTDPIYGPLGSEEMEQVLADPHQYGVLKTQPDDTIRGRELHGDIVPFFQMSTPGFCGTCHDVFGPNGFRLEDLFSEYKAGPAAKEECTTCQDCHMGKVPGQKGGFDHGPIAFVGNRYTPSRRRTNHMMAGPDYSILHPGVFPHHTDAIREKDSDPLDFGLATAEQWLEFNIDAKWGMDEFEMNIPKGYEFPDHWGGWMGQERRVDARRILDDQFKLLAEYRVQATQVLQAGYKMSEICDPHCDRDGLHFKLKVWNGTTGHSAPSGFDADRLVYLDIRVWDDTGKMLFRSGDLDPNGDIRDAHSFYVHNGVLPADHQVFTLQSRFITRNIRGGEREQILPINYSTDPLPFLRPLTRPMNVLGRPLDTRKHKQNLEIGGHRWAKYHVKSKYLSGNGPYHVSATLRAQTVPVNLIHRISIAGFDYGLTAREVARRVVEGSFVLYHEQATFNIHTR